MQQVKEELATTKALKRYRRIKTIINKALETDDKCGVHFNIVIYDPKAHKLREHYTSSNLKLSEMHLLREPMQIMTKSKKYSRPLKFQSIDAR